MPGKVNPVISEVVRQIEARVAGNDLTVSRAATGGNFELNTMWPVAIYAVLESVSLLANAAWSLDTKCVAGIIATPRGPELVEKGFMLATALVPYVGYKKVVEIVREAQRSGRTIREIAREQTDLSDEKLMEILDPSKMV
jgi:fumarate hydratase class II